MATQPKPGSEDRSVQTVLNAFDTLFNKRDYASAERFWSPHYIQHSAHIPPGRDGLFALVKACPRRCATRTTLRRRLVISSFSWAFSGPGPTPAWVVADIVRMEDGRLAEHWDVIQTRPAEQSRSGLPTFGDIPGLITKRMPERDPQPDVRPSLPGAPSRLF
jgi:predicted SnoaL-like aldol condensation-catalyzing enzyme